MPVRWSPLKVKEATDRVEEIINPILEPLEQAKQVVAEARKIPNLPEYMGQRLTRLEGEIERVTGGIGQDFVRGSEGKGSYQEAHRKGYIHRAIEDIRKDLPKEDLAKEQADFQRLLTFFGGDRQKAELTLQLSKPKATKVPSDQMAMDIVQEKAEAEAIEPEGKNNRDYIYCEDCQMFVDFWKYDHNIGDAGHDGHNWRYVTEEELEDCIADCEGSGCFEENML